MICSPTSYVWFIESIKKIKKIKNKFIILLKKYMKKIKYN